MQLPTQITIERLIFGQVNVTSSYCVVCGLEGRGEGYKGRGLDSFPYTQGDGRKGDALIAAEIRWLWCAYQLKDLLNRGGEEMTKLRGGFSLNIQMKTSVS